MADLGTNLSNYPNLEFLTGRTEKELLEQLKQIRLPHKIISIYGLNGRHIAWVSLTKPIKKVTQTEIKNN